VGEADTDEAELMADRHAITLDTPMRVSKARAWFDRAAQLAWRVEFRAPKRSDPQNDRLWEMLGRVSKRLTINGKHYTPDQWKVIFMKQMGREAQFLPTLDGDSFFPTGFRSSQLSVGEMSDLQTLIEAECAARGVDIWGQE
jgi:hypothetical protein